MAELTPDKKVLEYLSQFGIGNYRSITHILFELFPDNQDYQDFKYRNLQGRVWRFLNDLQHNQFIKIHIDLTEADSYTIDAAIQLKGIEYLASVHKGNSSTIHITGSHNQVIGQSSESLNTLRNIEINPAIEAANKPIDKKPKTRLVIELVSWMVGILIGLIGIWQFIIPLFSDSSKGSVKKEQVIGQPPNSTDSNKPKIEFISPDSGRYPQSKNLNKKLKSETKNIDELEKTISRLDNENKKMSEKIKSPYVFAVSALHFTAIDAGESKEQETSQSRKAIKFVVSFILQNNFNEFMNAEVIIVIAAPDGSILQGPVWDSGSFNTKTESGKSYTRKIRFDYEKGEQKGLIFSLDIDTFQKGTYTLQLWHNGQLIGEIEKILN